MKPPMGGFRIEKHGDRDVLVYRDGASREASPVEVWLSEKVKALEEAGDLMATGASGSALAGWEIAKDGLK